MSDQKPTGHPTVIDIYVDDKDTLDALAEALGATPEEVWATFTFARHILANAEGQGLTPPQLLNAMIFSLGLEREQTYIANVLKCRPPDNRDPLGEEVRSCEAYLHRQIQLIEPRLIIALGRFAAQSLLKSSLPIGKLRGQSHSYEPFGIPLIATYHPAYLLRSPLEKRKAWFDLTLAKTVLS